MIFCSVTLFLLLSCTDGERNNPFDPHGASNPVSSWIVAGNTLTDPDGNTYTTVTIGTQTWTVENLRTTKFNDGTSIPHVSDSIEWSGLYSTTSPGYCFYNNSTSALERVKWGALYNWYAINTGKLAPEGWRVPSEEDWLILENYLIASGYNYDGSNSGNKIGKSLAAKTDWESSSSSGAGAIGNDLSSNNRSGFSALPCGYRLLRGDRCYFYAQGSSCTWWSSSEYDSLRASTRGLIYIDNSLENYSLSGYKFEGKSVRLVRD